MAGSQFSCVSASYDSVFLKEGGDTIGVVSWVELAASDKTLQKLPSPLLTAASLIPLLCFPARHGQRLARPHGPRLGPHRHSRVRQQERTGYLDC